MPRAQTSRTHGGAIRRAHDLEGFLADPRRACLAGDAFAFYNLGAVCGWRVWGQPTREEARQLVACIATAYAPGAPPYFSLVDLRGLQGVDGSGFEVLLEFVKSKREQMATQLVRQAVVRPAGLMGALAAGFYVLLRPRHQVRVFDSLEDAARWLRASDKDALEELVAAFEAEIPPAEGLSTRLRGWLANHLAEPSPAAAAGALAVSLRTMQRKLKSEATSFHGQLQLARVEAAQRLLVASRLKLAAIAQESGFVSSQHLATSFKKLTGMTPSQFRERFRGKLEAEK